MTNAVTVERADLLALLRTFKSAKRTIRQGGALVSMEGNDLVIALTGMAASAPATGAWVGEVRVRSSFIIGIAQKPPSGDPLRVFVSDGRFWIGNVSTDCVVQKAWQSEIELPLQPNLLTVLGLPFRYPSDRIERAGLARTLADAQAEAQRLFAGAADVLTPLGITATDLAQILNDRLKRDLENK